MTEYSVVRGASVSSVATDLKSRGFIDSETGFKVLVRSFGGSVKSGIYDVPRGTSSWKLARMMVHGRVATVAITVPEGLTVRQIVADLADNEFLTGDSCVFVDAGEKIGDDGFECPPDGALFPDTYHVAKGTTRMSMIYLMQKKMQTVEKKWRASGKRPPRPLKDWNDVVTLASIVQKETPKVSEMPTVASVYINRLRGGMRLQADPTVVYAITNRVGHMAGRTLWTNDLKRESPYNTYLNAGLPPAPIANVGLDAIRSVLNPADTNYLFFVADGTGGHVFSKNYDEHMKNQNIWREIKRARESAASAEE